MAGPVQLTNETLRKPGELDPSDGIELSVRGTEERHMTHATRIPCYFCGGPATHSREIAGAGKRFACDGCPTKRVAQMKPARRTYPGDIAAYAQFGIAAVVIGAVSWPGFSELVAVSPRKVVIRQADRLRSLIPIVRVLHGYRFGSLRG